MSRSEDETSQAAGQDILSERMGIGMAIEEIAPVATSIRQWARRLYISVNPDAVHQPSLRDSKSLSVADNLSRVADSLQRNGPRLLNFVRQGNTVRHNIALLRKTDQETINFLMSAVADLKRGELAKPDRAPEETEKESDRKIYATRVEDLYLEVETLPDGLSATIFAATSEGLADQKYYSESEPSTSPTA